MTSGKLYGSKDNFRVKKVLVTAKFAKKQVDLAGEVPPVEVSPFGITPAYVEGEKKFFGTGAIIQHLAASTLGGKCDQVRQWSDWGEINLLPNVLGYVLPSVSAAQLDKKVVDLYKNELFAQLTLFNQYLLSKTFLVGEQLTVADISVAFNLLPAFESVFDEKVRKQFQNVTRWFNTVFNQPQTKEVVGDVKLATKVSQFDEAEFKKNSAKSAKAAPAKKEEKKKDQPKKADKKPEEELDAADAALAAEPKQKDPFESLPKTTFNFDAFKRVYSNEDTLTKALPYFWDNFDPENCSIWRCDYKYNDELTLSFMSCNLISGMFQRLEKLKKNSFASMILFGTDNNSQISGIWVWRGHDLAFELSPDWQVDYESYDWKKLDPKDESTKKTVNEYFLWEGDFEGKKFNQGKIFK